MTKKEPTKFFYQMKIKINRNPRSNARHKKRRKGAKLLRIAYGPTPEGCARWTLRFLKKQIP